MNYTDISKQKNILKKQRNDKGITKMFLLLAVIFVVGIILYFFRDKVKQAFSPISIIGNVSALDLKQTDGRTNILLLGSDKRTLGPESGRNTLTDTILVASIGNIENDVVLISLPRDLWIPNYGSKINAIYALSERNQIGSGMEKTKSAIEEVLAIPIHYEVMVTFDLFENMINILDGVEVNVENSFTDTAYPIEGRENDTCGKSAENIEKVIKEAEESEKTVDYFSLFPCRYEIIVFEQGIQKMDGETALRYARSRHGNNNEGTDFARSKRQQNLIMAIKGKALSLETLINPIKLKELYDTYSTNVETNVELKDIQNFYLLSQKLDFNKVVSVVLDDRSEANDGGLLYAPSDRKLYNGQYVLIPQTGDFSQIHAYVQKYIFGDK